MKDEILYMMDVSSIIGTHSELCSHSEQYKTCVYNNNKVQWKIVILNDKMEREMHVLNESKRKREYCSSRSSDGSS